MSAAYPPPAAPSALPQQGSTSRLGNADGTAARPLEATRGAGEHTSSHKTKYPRPLLRLHVQDLSHPAAKLFLDAVDPTKAVLSAVETVMSVLYGVSAPASVHVNRAREEEDSSDEESSNEESVSEDGDVESCKHCTNTWPEVRSITLILDMHGGVAETSGLALDRTHKEIRLNMGYVWNVAPKDAPSKESSATDASASATPTPAPTRPPSQDRLTAELTGVLVHEVVHTLQHARLRNIPGGLIEGIADWVRLRAGLAPPHWRREAKEKEWDDGYATTAWFLDWLECEKLGAGLVRRVNALLGGSGKYKEKEFWKEVVRGSKRDGGEDGKDDVEGLWKEYGEWLEQQEK